VTRTEGRGQYDVIVQVEATSRAVARDIREIFVRSANGGMVPLTSLVKVARPSARAN